MIKLIRQHILKNNDIKSLVNNSIFHIEKPLQDKSTTYIVMKDKLLYSKITEQYHLTFNIVSDDMEKVILLEKELVKYLNDVREEVILEDDKTFIRNISLLNGGGKIRTEDNDFMAVLYFKVIVQYK